MKTVTTLTNPAPVRISATRYQVASRTAHGVTYTVLVLADDSLSCNCAGGVQGRCWHMDAVRKLRDGRVCQTRPARQMPDPALGMALLLGKGR